MKTVNLVDLQDIESEKACLGALLFCGKKALTDVLGGRLCSEDFAVQANSEIFKAILALYQKGLKIDASSLAVKLRERAVLPGNEVVALVAEIVQKSGANLFYLADRLHHLADNRRLLRAIWELNDMLSRDELTQDKALSVIMEAMSAKREGGLLSVRDLMLDISEKIFTGELNKGLKTGFEDLDALTGGFKPGQLVLLSARPAMGKSALASNIALNVMKAGGRVAFFSLEMSKDAIITRMIAELGGLDMRVASEQRILDSCGELYTLPLWVCDSSARRMSVSAIRLELMRQQAQGCPPALVVIDYLGLIQAENTKASTYEQVTAISKDLKLLAMELNCPFLVLAQLNRGLEKEKDKRPRLSDLRDSGSLEQDADIVLGLFREGYYTKDAQDKTAELHVLKVRDGGQPGAIPLLFDGAKTTFIGLPAGKWEKCGNEWLDVSSANSR